MKADKNLIEQLEKSLNSAATGLAKTSTKKMFGCHALFADGNVFGLVWKHGRIGVKLTETSDYEKLMSTKGSEAWKAGPMKMAHWVLIPEKFSEDEKFLKPWLKLAHKQALTAPKKPKAAKKKIAKAKN